MVALFLKQGLLEVGPYRLFVQVLGPHLDERLAQLVNREPAVIQHVRAGDAVQVVVAGDHGNRVVELHKVFSYIPLSDRCSGPVPLHW